MYYKVKISILALAAISLIGCDNSPTPTLKKPFKLEMTREAQESLSQRLALVKIVNDSDRKLYNVDLRQISYVDHNSDGIISDDERIDNSVKLFEQLSVEEIKTIPVSRGTYYIRYYMDSKGGNIINNRSYPYPCMTLPQESYAETNTFKLSWANNHCGT